MKEAWQPQYVRKKSFPPERSFEHGISLLNSAELSLLWKPCANLERP